MSVIFGRARFSDRSPGEILITAEGEEKGESHQGPRHGPPGIRHLHPTGWKNVPGQHWDADTTGAWRCLVFRHEA